MSRHFPARWSSDCCRCGERIEEGDMAVYAEERNRLAHLHCPTVPTTQTSPVNTGLVSFQESK